MLFHKIPIITLLGYRYCNRYTAVTELRAGCWGADLIQCHYVIPKGDSACDSERRFCLTLVDSITNLT